MQAVSFPDAALRAAGFAEDQIERWKRSRISDTNELAADAKRYGEFWRQTASLLARLPAKPKRSDEEQALAQNLIALGREARERFLKAHAMAVYDEITRSRSEWLRLDELCYRASERFPGLVPSREAVQAEARFPQRDKDGVEIDQGVFLSHVLADPVAGEHLVQAMLMPTKEALAAAPEFEQKGEAQFAGARLERRGNAAIVNLRNPRFLNAEDDTTLQGAETAVDVALLDRHSSLCVIRGDAVPHPKYGGSRVFGAGINLTHIYQGKIPYLWYLTRDLGYVNKLYRGLWSEGARELAGPTHEKVWIAAVERYAIGGHCQIVLAVDYILAAAGSYFSLPARKEGIIPGAANLRLPRFIGDRLARQAILYDRRFECESPEGRLLCDRIVPADQMDAAVDETVSALSSSGVVSAAGNRRAIRVAQEPIDLFRRYMAVYAYEQALCHFSPALIANLERHWNAMNRRG